MRQRGVISMPQTNPRLTPGLATSILRRFLLYIGRMFDLKPISPEAVPVALAKAERYRLLNEPWQAESICRDILRVEPEHDQALIMLLLALTDQFGKGVTAAQAREVLTHLKGDYERAYYA